MTSSPYSRYFDLYIQCSNAGESLVAGWKVLEISLNLLSQKYLGGKRAYTIASSLSVSGISIWTQDKRSSFSDSWCNASPYNCSPPATQHDMSPSDLSFSPASCASSNSRAMWSASVNEVARLSWRSPGIPSLVVYSSKLLKLSEITMQWLAWSMCPRARCSSSVLRPMINIESCVSDLNIRLSSGADQGSWPLIPITRFLQAEIAATTPNWPMGCSLLVSFSGGRGCSCSVRGCDRLVGDPVGAHHDSSFTERYRAWRWKDAPWTTDLEIRSPCNILNQSDASQSCRHKSRSCLTSPFRDWFSARLTGARDGLSAIVNGKKASSQQHQTTINRRNLSPFFSPTNQSTPSQYQNEFRSRWSKGIFSTRRKVFVWSQGVCQGLVLVVGGTWSQGWNLSRINFHGHPNADDFWN